MTAYVLVLALAQSPPSPMWQISYCQTGDGVRLVGSGLAVSVAKSSKIKTGSDIDYTCSAVQLRDRKLRFTACEGPHWTSGRPPGYLLRGASDVQERRIHWPEMPADWVWDYGPVDVRGTSASGTRWRYIGIIGASITYDDAPPASARALDVVFDSLCWRQTAVDKNAGR